MADLYTTQKEEATIKNILNALADPKESLSGFPKYIPLRIAFMVAMRLSYLELDSDKWEEHKNDDTETKGSEYHLAQITGKDPKNQDKDFDILYRGMIYNKHKAWLESNKINIFNDEQTYLECLRKYIKRGLYEISISWEPKDCIYQYLSEKIETKKIDDSVENTHDITPKDMIDRIISHYDRKAVKIEIVNTTDSFRHIIYRIKVLDSAKLSVFAQEEKYLPQIIGVESVMIRSCNKENLNQMYDVQISKQENQWQKLGIKEFESGRAELTKLKNKKNPILIGYKLNKTPLDFDLDMHTMVAGTSGSGKSVFIGNMILCLLLNKNTDIVLIDPKNGEDYGAFKKYIKIVGDKEESVGVINETIEEMNNLTRDNLKRERIKVVIIDELNNLVETSKKSDDVLGKIEILVRQSRSKNIFLVLGSQRPESKVFGMIKANIKYKIALKTATSSNSKIILDETGAEKLLGKGDMLFKSETMSEPERLLGIKLNVENEDDEDIKRLLREV